MPRDTRARAYAKPPSPDPAWRAPEIQAQELVSRAEISLKLFGYEALKSSAVLASLAMQGPVGYAGSSSFEAQKRSVEARGGRLETGWVSRNNMYLQIPISAIVVWN